jgi:hypothetical protein
MNGKTKKQIKAYLKNGLALLVAVLICGWVTYKLLNPRMTERHNDFTIDASLDWLEAADHEKFDVCRKNIIDADSWFNLFMLDRKSLDKVKARIFTSRREFPDTGNGLKRYELKFVSNFSESPQGRDIYEQLIVESDNRSQFKVINADYWLYDFRPNRTVVRSLTEEEKQHIRTMSEDILKKVDARETTFFKQAYAEWAERPDYFHSNKWIAAEAKSGKTIAKLYKILSTGKASPWKFDRLKTYSPVGRTGFECNEGYYSFSVNSEAKSKNFILEIDIIRDLYLDKSAEWKFFGLWFWEKKD